jgi:hypothetical protein
MAGCDERKRNEGTPLHCEAESLLAMYPVLDTEAKR